MTDEASTGRRPIEPTSTSVTALVGPAGAGPSETPTTVTGLAELETQFGPAPGSALGRAAADFFANDGAVAVVVRSERASDGLAALLRDGRTFQLLVIDPGITEPGDLAAADAACEEVRAFLIADATPDGTVPAELLDAGARNAAVYHPRLVDAQGTPRTVAPAVAGVFARNDRGRGVWRSCGGMSARVAGAAGLERRLTDRELSALGARGVNALRVMPDGATVVWGDRTVSSQPEWKYVNVRRTLLFLEHSIEAGLQWAVLEPNDEPLWKLVRADVEEFLEDLWRQGAFPGATPEQGFFVRCDRTTMSPGDIEAGRLVVEVGVATMRPAEFVVLRIGVPRRPANTP